MKRFASTVVVGYLFFTTCLGAGSYLTHIQSGADLWIPRDWLINYSGGFIRRGFLGELLRLTNATGRPLLLLLFTFQVLIVISICAVLLLGLKRANFSAFSIALVLGPAGIAFLGLFPPGGFGKEHLVLLVLALFVASSWTARFSIALKCVGLTLFMISVLTWESSVVVLPLLISQTRLWPQARFWTGAVCALGLLGLISVLMPIHPETLNSLCASFREEIPQLDNPCGPPLPFLAMSSSEALNQILSSLTIRVLYIPAFILTILPVVLSRWAKYHFPLFLCQLFLFLPLFAVGTDWFRWIHFISVAFTLAILKDSGFANSTIRWPALMTFGYVLLWGVYSYDDGWVIGGIPTTVMRILERAFIA